MILLVIFVGMLEVCMRADLARTNTLQLLHLLLEDPELQHLFEQSLLHSDVAKSMEISCHVNLPSTTANKTKDLQVCTLLNSYFSYTLVQGAGMAWEPEPATESCPQDCHFTPLFLVTKCMLPGLRMLFPKC